VRNGEDWQKAVVVAYFEVLSLALSGTLEYFVGGTEPDRRMSRYLQSAGEARNWRVTAVLTCSLSTVTVHILPYSILV
jgi:hypothetical protein